MKKSSSSCSNNVEKGNVFRAVSREMPADLTAGSSTASELGGCVRNIDFIPTESTEQRKILACFPGHLFSHGGP